MPLHDWTRVPAGLFHHFRQDWSIEIARSLNRGILPHGVAALVEQRAGPLEADVPSIEAWNKPALERNKGGIATMPAPVTQFVRRSDKALYATRANRIVLKHHLGRMIAVIEITSLGNKDSRAALRDFVEKVVDCLRGGVHVLVVDPFPPTQRDPSGIHKVIWNEITEEDFVLPPGKERTLASYPAGPERVAYIEPVGIGETLPDMPLFLSEHVHVMTPLESTYQAAWQASPEELRVAVKTGSIPAPAES